MLFHSYDGRKVGLKLLVHSVFVYGITRCRGNDGCLQYRIQDFSGEGFVDILKRIDFRNGEQGAVVDVL